MVRIDFNRLRFLVIDDNAHMRRIVRTLAKSTLLAAGIAVTHLGVAEIDSRFKVFDRTLVDRLQAPITRYHE